MFLTHAATLTLIGLLVAASIIDWRTQRLPNPLNLLILLTGAAATALLDRDLLAALIGVAAGYALVAGANLFYRWRRGRDGIGMGDAKLLAAGGAWVGWSAAPMVLVLAASLTIVALSLARLLGHRIEPSDRVPFGPALAFALAAAWIAQVYDLAPPSG